MRRLYNLILLFALLCMFSPSAFARTKVYGSCNAIPPVPVAIPGTQGSGAQRFFSAAPSCTITFYYPGTVTLVPGNQVYSDESGTVKGNPFTATTGAQWFAYVDVVNIDVKFSGGSLLAPYTIGDYITSPIAFVTGFGAKCDGVTDDSSAFMTANSVLSVNGGDLIIPSGQNCVVHSVTTATNVNVTFQAGGMVSVTTAYTATFDGSVSAPLQQIFTGSGNVVLTGSRVAALYPEWWGAKGDGSTDDTAALNRSITAAINSGIPVQLRAANYLANTATNGVILNILVANCTLAPQNPVVSPCGLSIRGAGVQKTQIVTTTASADLLAAISSVFSNPYYEFSDFSLRGPDTQTPRTQTSGNGLRVSGSATPLIHAKNLAISNFFGSGEGGLWIDNVEDSEFDHIALSLNDIGLKLTTAANNLQFNMLTLGSNHSFGLNCSGSAGITFVAPLIESNEQDGAYFNCTNSHFVDPWFENNSTSATSTYYDLENYGYTNTYTSPIFNSTGEKIIHLIGTGNGKGGNTFISAVSFGTPSTPIVIDTGAAGNTWINGVKSAMTGTGISPFIETILGNDLRSTVGTSILPFMQPVPVAYATLISLVGSCSSGTDGLIALISDLNTTIPGATITVGGGGLRGLVQCVSGTGWQVIAGATLTGTMTVNGKIGANNDPSPNAPFDLLTTAGGEAYRATVATNASYSFFRAFGNGGDGQAILGASWSGGGGEVNSMVCGVRFPYCLFAGPIQLPSYAFASLPTAGAAIPNGAMVYCSDCQNVVNNSATAGAVCAASGNGAVARRENGHWACN